MSDVEFQTKVEQSLATFSRRSTDDELGVEEFIYISLLSIKYSEYRGLSRFVASCKEA